MPRFIALSARASALAIGTAIAVGSPAFAQTATSEAQPTEDKGVEEIIVTAQFRAQNLQDTPIAITAVSAAMLEARSQTNISEVANQAPNVTLKPASAAFGPSLGASIRGIGQYDFNPALEPGVGMYVDDVYYATLTGSIFDLLDLDRVEISRGPQGTLAGRNSIGGAIKLYSKKPKGDGSGYVEGTYGSRNRVDLRASADLALTPHLFARLSGVSKKQEGYVDRLDYGCLFPTSGVTRLTSSANCRLAKESEVDYNAIRGMLRWEASSAVEINLIGDYTHDDRTVAGNVLTFASYTGANDVNPFPTPIPYDSRFICGKFCNYSTFISFADGATPYAAANGRTKLNSWGVSGKIDWNIGEHLALESISAYRAYTAHFSNDDNLSPLANSLGRNDLSFWSVSQELRLNGSLGGDQQLEYTIGGFYLDQKSVYATMQDLRYAGLPQFIGDDPVNADTQAAFVHATWNVTDRLGVTGGLRYTEESKDYTFVRLTPAGARHPVLGALTGVTGKYSEARVDYRANAQYRWTANVMTYAQFSTGFKGGGINPRPFVATQVQPFGPETLRAFEIGLKSDLFDRRARINVAAFANKYKDIQLTALTCPAFSPPVPNFPCALPQNAADADIKGVELEASVRPVQGLMIDASVSYLDFEYTRISPAAGAPASGTAPARGVQLDYAPPFVPKWKWSVGIQYEMPVGTNASVTPRFDSAFQDDFYTNAVNGPNSLTRHYILANARLTYRDSRSKWEASLAVTNLFNKYYFLTTFDAGSGSASGQPGRPREWAVSVKKSF